MRSVVGLGRGCPERAALPGSVGFPDASRAADRHRLLRLRCDYLQAQRVSIKKVMIWRSFRKGVLTNRAKLSRQP